MLNFMGMEESHLKSLYTETLTKYIGSDGVTAYETACLRYRLNAEAIFSSLSLTQLQNNNGYEVHINKGHATEFKLMQAYGDPRGDSFIFEDGGGHEIVL